MAERTVFFDRHAALKARMTDFGGWEMPLQYPTGILAEHLATRKGAGLFDVSHMGRFIISGEGALAFLQHVLTGNAAALDVDQAQYTIIPDEKGCAVDDAYLYRFDAGEYLLVVNAANRLKDWDHLRGFLKDFPGVRLEDRTEAIAMLSFQGPASRRMLEDLIDGGALPEPARNALGEASIAGIRTRIGRTGYTGEPLCFELFTDRDDGPRLWDLLIAKGATPVGLGARDTLRLEAALPLYGHEFGADPEGREIPILAVPLARVAVSFSPLKGEYVGRRALERQYEAYRRILRRDYSRKADLPRRIKPIALVEPGVARAGAKVFREGTHVGYVTSGTTVPLWTVEGEGLASTFTDTKQLRSICLGYIDSELRRGDRVTIDVRGTDLEALIVPYHLRSEAPPYARPILWNHAMPEKVRPDEGRPGKAAALLRKAIDNHLWRQTRCVDLIPSEMTISPMCRLLSVTDPAFRYAEHRSSKAFDDAEIFYYQGTGFIEEVERLLEAEMRAYLGCPEVELRLISGQMANTALFSAMLSYLNRAGGGSEPRRIARVMNNHIGRGGHLSAQPMGALRDFVAKDPRTERAAVVNFPVLADNPYKMDVPAAIECIDRWRPELIILGKSMVIHREPVAEIRRFLDASGIDAVLMYDMAHVLGLIGPHFQEPFAEGADFVTGSTHKTFFGTQRGVIGSRFEDGQERYALWEAVRRRAFPGSVSNHHLGTLLGLLMAAYE
ncbi:MAG: glycine cleavage system protein T, partial [Planctomycetes bacterium]|nr:glycine cleavage system protein T [Planctomycetota bacterium]